MENTSVTPTAVRQVSRCGLREVGEWRSAGMEDGVDINLSPAGGPSTPTPRPHGGLECVENSADGVAQTKHTLCWWVTDGVNRHSHGSLQRRLHGNEMWRRLTAGDLSCGRAGLSGC
uniref:PPUP8702 n=1 Tax=Poeciliopsis prolifica TaxID=188132 RepID=A0A0S7EQC2_9TELE